MRRRDPVESAVGAAETVRRFEDESENACNFDIVDELVAEGFVHHLPYPDGRACRDECGGRARHGSDPLHAG
jgi:hypothetical protein